MTAERGTLAGSVRWGVVPYSPAPPLRLYAGEGHAPIVVPDADRIIAAARTGGDVELTYLIAGKARPILLLSEPSPRYHEVAALRLLRLSRLGPDERDRVRADEDDLLFPLAPARFELPEESAAIVPALVRVSVDAIGTGPTLGRLDPRELSVLGERVVSFFGFDIRALVERRIRELAARRRERTGAGPEVSGTSQA